MHITDLDFCPICTRLLGHSNYPRDVDLCALFIRAQQKVWCDIGDCYDLGYNIGEDSITDMILLEMSRCTNQIAVKRYNSHEENRESGGDWLWWFVSGNKGFPVLIQAKRLYKNNKYEKLEYKKYSKKNQINKLLNHAKNNKYLALYCFYNFWNGSSPWKGGPNEWDSPWWGCSISPAIKIKQNLLDNGSDANKIENIGPGLRPWSVLVCPCHTTDNSNYSLPERVAANLRAAFRKTFRKIENLPEIRIVPNDVFSLLEQPPDQNDSPDYDVADHLNGIVVFSDRPIRWRAREKRNRN